MNFGCRVVYIHLLHVVVGQSGDIKHLLLGEFLGIGVVKLHEFLIALAEDVDLCHHARIAELGKNLVGELVEHGGEVADLTFALLGIGIHAKYAEYKVFVLNIALLHEFLEPFPVLWCERGSEFTELRDFILFELVFHKAGGVLFPFLREFLVEVVRSFRRSV